MIKVKILLILYNKLKMKYRQKKENIMIWLGSFKTLEEISNKMKKIKMIIVMKNRQKQGKKPQRI